MKSQNILKNKLSEITFGVDLKEYNLLIDKYKNNPEKINLLDSEIDKWINFYNRNGDKFKDSDYREIDVLFDDEDISTIKIYNQNKKLKIKSEPINEIVLLSKFTPVPFAERLINKYKFFYDLNKILWKYDINEGIWEPNSEQFIKTELRRNLMADTQQMRNYVEEIINYIKDVSYNPEFKMDGNPYLIPLKSKVYNLKSGEFINYSSDLHLSNKLNIDVDDTIQECPKIDEFFEESVGVNKKIMLYELIAYTLFKEMPYQKLFFIHGSAGTGKSKFMELVERFLGEKNRCSVEPKSIQNDIYSSSQMENKFANIVSDINYDEFENITQVKKLTGGDTISIRRMYREPYNTHIYAKQIFSTNKLPVVREKTRAWYRRVYLIPFDNIVSNEKRDPFLLEKLTSDEEMKGLTFICLKLLKDLYERKFVFSYDPDENQMAKQYEELSNPILMFLQENCEFSSLDYVFQWELKERLKVYLRNKHFPQYSNSEIKKFMNENYGESSRLNWQNKSNRVWMGLKWSK